MQNPKPRQTANVQVNVSRVLATTMRHWKINTTPVPDCLLQGAASSGAGQPTD